MAYTRRELYTLDKNMQRYLDTLMKNMVVEMPPSIAQCIGKHKTIQRIRQMDKKNPYILIGRDDKYHISIVKIREPVKIKKDGNKYSFFL
jgi:hypothetical protein